jgi:hypothetical protein
MPVQFTDGEPVDPIKLQNLQDQITSVKGIADKTFGLINTSTGQTVQTIPVVAGGRELFKQCKAGTIYERTLVFGSVFRENEIPTVVASSRAGLGKGSLEVAVIYYTGSPTLQVRSTGNKEPRDVYVDYIAFFARPINT